MIKYITTADLEQLHTLTTKAFQVLENYRDIDEDFSAFCARYEEYVQLVQISCIAFTELRKRELEARQKAKK